MGSAQKFNKGGGVRESFSRTDPVFFSAPENFGKY